MLEKLAKTISSVATFLTCQGHFREEGRYGEGRYFHFSWVVAPERCLAFPLPNGVVLRSQTTGFWEGNLPGAGWGGWGGGETFGGSQDRVVSTRVVLVDVPWTPKTGTRVQKHGMTVPKTGTRLQKTERRYQKLKRGYKKAERWYQKNTKPGYKKRSDGTKKLERGYIRQNHPFTKPPFCSSRNMKKDAKTKVSLPLRGRPKLRPIKKTKSQPKVKKIKCKTKVKTTMLSTRTEIG